MKKIIALCVAFVLFFTGAANSFGAARAPSLWAQESIGQAEDLKIIPAGFSSGWQQGITREQFCELAYNFLDTVMEIDWKAVSPAPFQDTDNEKVISLVLQGIVEGKTETLFMPDGILSREESAVFLQRIASYMGIPDFPVAVLSIVYRDDSEIAEWAKDAVYQLYGLSLMVGENNMFLPKEPYTAEQAVATLMRLYDAAHVRQTASFADCINALMPQDTNYVFSPLSVEMMLSLAASGASGQTQEEICSALGINSLDMHQREVKKLLEKYSQSDLLRLKVFNALWINQSKTEQRFSQAFLDIAGTFYQAVARQVTQDTALQKINSWASESTDGKIPEILSEEDTDFWALLANAVYFKGRWQNEFLSSATREEIFTQRDGTQKDIHFMNQTGWMPYSVSGGVQIVELPYLTRAEQYSQEGKLLEEMDLDLDISMYLMMAEGDFSPEETLRRASFENRYISLSVPRFTITYEGDLNSVLTGLGIKKAFQEDAEFQNMFDIGNMFLTKALHKAYISIDEEGTEAAAVTAGMMAENALPPEPVVVKFNRPFTFVIQDNDNKEILFMGAFAFPE